MKLESDDPGNTPPTELPSDPPSGPGLGTQTPPAPVGPILGSGAPLNDQERGAGGEIQLTDAMAKLIGQQPFHAYRFEGDRYDCGSAAGFVIANLAMALERDDVGPAVKDYLSSRT